MLLDVLDELVAVARNDKLHIREVVILENRLPDSAAVIVVNRIDGIVEDDQGAFDTLCLCQ